MTSAIARATLELYKSEGDLAPSYMVNVSLSYISNLLIGDILIINTGAAWIIDDVYIPKCTCKIASRIFNGGLITIHAVII